jgi:hypothetical protein
VTSRRGKPHSLERGNFRLFPFANQLIQRLAKDGKGSRETCDSNHYFQASSMFVPAFANNNA